MDALDGPESQVMNNLALLMTKMVIDSQTEPSLLNIFDLSFRMYLVQNLDIKVQMI